MKRALIAVLGASLALTCAAESAQPPAPASAPQTQLRQLRILQRVMPNFESGSDGGCVTVKFVIRHDGFVGDVTVLEAKPEALGEPMAAALKQWWFQSFPPPDLVAVQTFQFQPEQVRLPDNAIRAPYLALDGGGALKSAVCGASKGDTGGKPEAKK